MSTILIGGLITIGVSLFTEFVSWVSKKVTGTPLNGQGAFVSTIVVSIVGGVFYLLFKQVPENYIAALSQYSLVFLGGATVVFNWVVVNVPAIHVTPDVATPSPASTGGATSAQ